MALVHQATLTPSKLELLSSWLPSRTWFREGGELTRVGSYRFDDPAGEVGIEIMMVQSGDSIFQVPLTYHGSPLPGADEFLLGAMEHSVLGARWIYDGCGDPVFVGALATAILTGASEAMVELEVAGEMTILPSTVSVKGSGQLGTTVPAIGSVSAVDEGAVTIVSTGSFQLHVVRSVDAQLSAPFLLTASWEGRANVPLMGLTLR